MGTLHSYKTHIYKLAQQSMLELLHLLRCYSRLVRWCKPTEKNHRFSDNLYTTCRRMQDATAKKSYVLFFSTIRIFRKVFACEIPRVGARFTHGTVPGFLMERCSASSWTAARWFKADTLLHDMCKMPQRKKCYVIYNNPDRVVRGSTSGKYTIFTVQ